MSRVRRAWTMFKVSLRVLKTRKELVLFPIISGAASLVVLVSFAVPLATSAVAFDSMAMPYVVIALGYFVLAYVAVFCQVALVSQADVALRGGDPTVAGGFRAAGGLWLRILPWALLSATVSQLLRVLEDRAPGLARYAVSLVGAAWSVVTYLVVPILVFERVGIGSGLKRSVKLVKGTWGENVVGNSGVGVIGFLLGLLALPVIALGSSSGSSTVLTACVVVAVVWVLLVTVLASALTGIYQTTLYHYAAEGTVPKPYAHADLAGALPARR